MLARNRCGLSPGPGRRRLALEVADAPDALVAEQLEAAEWTPAEHRDRVAGIERARRRRRNEVKSTSPRAIIVELGMPASDVDVADVGEAFRPQQLLGDVLRRDADARDLRASRIVVVSGGASSASDPPGAKTPAAPAADAWPGNRGDFA